LFSSFSSCYPFMPAGIVVIDGAPLPQGPATFSE